MFSKSRENGKLECQLCPHACLISAGRHGRCRVRFNKDGVLDLPFFGKLSSVAVDPIEKKPLYHFYPGQTILSVGFWGCSLHCPFCQNYAISQTTQVHSSVIAPEELPRMAKRRGSFGIAYTYSEPLVHIEYILAAARQARELGLKNVLVSNGFVCRGPAEELLEHIDAANIDLKTFNPEFYKREMGGDLAEVKRFIAQAREKIHLEVTTLVIPSKNDSSEEIDSVARFLADLDPNIPYHLSAYFPSYKYDLSATDPAHLRDLAAVARRHLCYVYLGNVGSRAADTNCRYCGSLLVRRSGYRVEVTGIQNGHCSQCAKSVPIPGV